MVVGRQTPTTVAARALVDGRTAGPENGPGGREAGLTVRVRADPSHRKASFESNPEWRSDRRPFTSNFGTDSPTGAGHDPVSDGHEHPGPSRIDLPKTMRSAIVAAAHEALPNEACGLVIGDGPAGEGGMALRWVPLRNALASQFRYEIDPDDLLRVTIETERRDEVIWAIVHSHVASPARPSPTDVRQSFYPEAIYLLVSLDPAEADPITGAESVRAWRIVDGTVHEVSLLGDLEPGP